MVSLIESSLVVQEKMLKMFKVDTQINATQNVIRKFFLISGELKTVNYITSFPAS
jgi:hypothetical protein